MTPLVVRHRPQTVGYLGLLFVSFGTSHTATLLTLLPGARWAGARGAVATLSWYCVYVLLLAVNGSLEAFAHAVATPAQVTTPAPPRRGDTVSRRALSAFCVLFADQVQSLGGAQIVAFVLFACAANPAMSRRGTAGLVLANCVSMGVRIVYCAVFVARYFAPRGEQHREPAIPSPLRRALPAPLVLGAFVVSFCLTHLSEASRRRGLDGIEQPSAQQLVSAHGAHVARGVLCLASVAAAFVFSERAFVRDLRDLRRSGAAKAE